MNKVPLTVKGAELLRIELHQLKTVERPKVIASIQEARSHGDLSENAEYDAAKERQSFIEGRIVEVESKLANAQIIDPAHLDADGRCVFGATVDLEEVDSRETVTYQIVGDDEADIKNNKISISSPIARALQRITPYRRPHFTLGSVMRQRMCQPEAPSTRAASSSSFPCDSISGISSRATNGKVTKMVASTIPGTANTMLMSCSCSQEPNQPWAPNSST